MSDVLTVIDTEQYFQYYKRCFQPGDGGVLIFDIVVGFRILATCLNRMICEHSSN